MERLTEAGHPMNGAGRSPVPAALLNVHQVAELLGCSVRHVYRLAETGRMPKPAKLGALVRWPQRAIESWVADGCPSCCTGGER